MSQENNDKQNQEVFSNFKRFLLIRDEDVSGVSGTGCVAEGIQFSDGTAVIHWKSKIHSTNIYGNIEEVLAIHGHGGASKIQFIDD